MSRSNEFEYRDLTVKAIRGDAEAFEQLYLRYTNSILYHARRYIRDPLEAEDAAQEAVIEMYRNIGTLKDPNAFVPWMYRLTKFVCLKHVRDLASKRGGQTAADLDDFVEILADESTDSDPAKAIVEDERTRTIRATIGRLPEKQREAVILFYYEGLSYREIAAAQGTTPSTVSTNIMKAKKKIALELEPAIALAVTADMGAKLSGISIPAFQAACKAGVAKSAAAGLGYGTLTGAGKYAAKGLKSLAETGKALSVCLTTATVVVIVSAVAVVSTPPEPAPAAEAPAAVTPQAPVADYMPDADIAFLGGDCDCGHVNPKSAALSLSDDTDVTESWEILSGGVAIASGTGTDAGLTDLPDGDYQIRYTVASEDGRKAYSARAFLILSEPFEDGLYL
jgi:RNA polymerase sigma-70 factor (ECF subfamily)